MDKAKELRALVDTLLPGDERFPAASSVGVHGLVAERLRTLIGTDGLSQIVESLEKSGGPLATASQDIRTEIVARFEQEHSDLFASVRKATYLSYYQNPIVVDAVRSLGHAYNDAPQPDGYRMVPFDPTDPQQAPTDRRGSYVRTASVKSVDLSALPEDPTTPEEGG